MLRHNSEHETTAVDRWADMIVEIDAGPGFAGMQPGSAIARLVYTRLCESIREDPNSDPCIDDAELELIVCAAGKSRDELLIDVSCSQETFLARLVDPLVLESKDGSQ